MGRKRGFTLMEMLIVVAIIGVLAAMLMPNIAGRSEEARKSRAQAEIASTLRLALTMFESDVGKFPTTQQGLDALVTNPDQVATWRGPYIDQAKRLNDPWGQRYSYQYPGQNNPQTYDLASAGPDGQFGTDDDITNWDDGQETTSY